MSKKCHSRVLIPFLLGMCLFLAPAAGATEESRSDTLTFQEGAPLLRSADGLSSLRLSMLMHADLRFPERSWGLEPSFLLRRARVQLDATVAGWLSARLILGDLFSNLKAPTPPLLKDAWLDLQLASWLELRVGRQKVPFSYEWLLTSSNQLDFIENSLSFSSLVPQYDLGAALHGRWWEGRGEYWLGCFNGDGDESQDSVGGKLMAAHVSVSPVKGVHLGASAAQELGNRRTSTELKGALATGQAFLGNGESVQVQPSRWLVGLEAVSYLGPFSLKSEYVQRDWGGGLLADRSQVPGVQGLRAHGFYASATWVFTGEDKTARGVTPRDPFSPRQVGHWGMGAWELGARYGALRLDFTVPEGPSGAGVTPSPDTTLQELTLGLRWYPNAQVRWMMDYSRYAFDGGARAFLGGRHASEVLMRVQLLL